MIVNQRDRRLFAPDVSSIPVVVIDTPGTTTSHTFDGMVFDKTVGHGYHYDYQITGSNLTGLFIAESSNTVALSNNLLQRGMGVNDFLVSVKLANERASLNNILYDFGSRVQGTATYSDPKSLVDGTYVKYSWDRTHEIFSQLDNGTVDNHRVFDSNYNRRNFNIIPHQFLTCQVVNAQLGGAKRFTAITKRHIIGCGHYGLHPIPSTVRFRDIDNNVITRIAIGAYNCKYGPYTIPNIPNDIEVWLLDADLPESITPSPIIGDWYYQYEGTKLNGSAAINAFGFASFNHDNHIVPTQTSFTSRISSTNSYSTTLTGVLLEGRDFNIFGYPSFVNLEGYESWGWPYTDSVFYHDRRSGDSGHPFFLPVEGGWALQFINGQLWRPEGLNALIKAVDAKHGINTGYTVTVAPNPIA